jgi:hypothetical protein
MNLRQLDKKYFGRQGEPEDVIVGTPPTAISPTPAAANTSTS